MEERRSKAELLAMARLELDAARAKFIGKGDHKAAAALVAAKRAAYQAHRAIFSVVPK